MYLNCDFLLLADVSEKFRCNSRYLSAPALSWDAMLNMTKVELEHVSDADIYSFFEKVMRGVVSYIFKRYSRPNNKYSKSYDPK